MATKPPTKPPILNEGTLKKQGGRLKTWKTRWFVLYEDGTMQYYGNQDKTRVVGEFSLKGHDLNIIPNDALDSQQSDRFLFEIKAGNGTRITDSHDSFLLWSTSEGEREKWLFHIKTILFKEAGGAIFGHPLSETMEYDGRKGCLVPRIVNDLVGYIEAVGMEAEGIFRLSGRKKLVTQLMDEYDRGITIDLRERCIDAHTAASVLKQYLRKLPEPLIPFDRFEQMGSYGTKLPLGIPEAYDLVRKGLDDLPTWNYNLLKYLIEFLVKIAGKEEMNKMSSGNLAAVHAPNILRMKDENPELTAAVNTSIVDTTKAFIDNCDVLFVKDYKAGELSQDDSLTASVTDTDSRKCLVSSESLNSSLINGSDSDLEKVAPGSEFLASVTEKLKKLLQEEQAARQGVQDELLLVQEDNKQLRERIRMLQIENGILRKKLDKYSSEKGNFV